jgi:2,3-bisphosphoglycerate-dependent phosphoglycerate mutase
MDQRRDLRVIFETHATSVDNEAGRASGWFDAGLSPTGEEQARTLGMRRRGDDLAAVFCSDLTRACRTAEIAFGDRAIPIVRDARLRECDYGALTRRPVYEIEARRATCLTTPFSNGESYEQVVERVGAWLDETILTYADRTVLLIGHRATFYALEHLIRKTPLHEVVTSPWQWQPGWTYRVTAGHRARTGPDDRRS